MTVFGSIVARSHVDIIWLYVCILIFPMTAPAAITATTTAATTVTTAITVVGFGFILLRLARLGQIDIVYSRSYLRYCYHSGFILGFLLITDAAIAKPLVFSRALR